MKRRKRMPFRSSFFWSVAGRAAASFAGNTIAPLIKRLGKTVTRKPHPTAARRQRQRVSSHYILRQRALDEQEMFDSQMMSLPRASSNARAPSGVGALRKEPVEDAATTPEKVVAVLNGIAGPDTEGVVVETGAAASARTFVNAAEPHDEGTATPTSPP